MCREVTNKGKGAPGREAVGRQIFGGRLGSRVCSHGSTSPPHFHCLHSHKTCLGQRIYSGSHVSVVSAFTQIREAPRRLLSAGTDYLPTSPPPPPLRVIVLPEWRGTFRGGVFLLPAFALRELCKWVLSGSPGWFRVPESSLRARLLECGCSLWPCAGQDLALDRRHRSPTL